MSVTEEYLRQKQERERNARLEAANQVQYDPDRASRVLAVSAALNLPEELVDTDLDNLETQARAQNFNRDNYTDQINGAPAFNRFAAENPYHLSVLERDHKNLSALERSYRQMSLGWQSGWAMTEIAEIRDRQLTDFENPDQEKTGSASASSTSSSRAGCSAPTHGTQKCWSVRRSRSRFRAG